MFNPECYETFRTQHGDETAALRYMEHMRLHADSYFFYVYDCRVTHYLREKNKKQEEEYSKEEMPLSTAMKCHSCSKLVEIGNNTVVCGTCTRNGKGNIHFESYFNDVDYFNK
jgi:hypothetical protein